jgi:tetratricopeptide (TPR) repeat protein
MDYWAGDLERAEQTFSSTEDITPGGAQWTYGDRLRSAVRGLQGLVGKHSERGDLGSACRVSDRLVELLPEDATMWNDAGFFHRDLATSIEFTARQLCRAAAGEEQEPDRLDELRDAAKVAPELYGTEAEKRIFREQSEAMLVRAKAEMERSRDAYERALELAPDDVVVLNDSALIYVYYLHTNLELAEQRLLRAIERGEALLADPDLPQEERDVLTVPYGDAHENLGVLYIEHREDAERARMYFEKAVEIGPGPRPIVTDYYLPICSGEDPGGFEAFNRDVLGWAAPCQ